MPTIQKYILKISRFLIVLMVILAIFINTYYQIKYSTKAIIVIPALLTLIGVIGFIYYSSQIIFKKVDFRNRKLVVCILGACTLLYVNYLYGIIAGTIPPLFQDLDESFLIGLGSAYVVYAILATYYFVCTCVAFFKIKKESKV